MLTILGLGGIAVGLAALRLVRQARRAGQLDIVPYAKVNECKPAAFLTREDCQ